LDCFDSKRAYAESDLSCLEAELTCSSVDESNEELAPLNYFTCSH
jgi:hypothetical protein